MEDGLDTTLHKRVSRHDPKRSIIPGVLLLLAWLRLMPTAQGATLSNSECMVCHDDPTLTRMVMGQTQSLKIVETDLKKSVHAQLNCTDCHAGIKDLPHPEKLPPPPAAVATMTSPKPIPPAFTGSAKAWAHQARQPAPVAMGHTVLSRSNKGTRLYSN